MNQENKKHRIKLNQQGHIKLFKANKDVSWDDVSKYIKSELTGNAILGGLVVEQIVSCLKEKFNPPTLK